ncbi:MAG: hypothetical protein V3V62_02635 [bacterium]
MRVESTTDMVMSIVTQKAGGESVPERKIVEEPVPDLAENMKIYLELAEDLKTLRGLLFDVFA